ncbi:hypothetical protein PRIPAC_96420 [Pristionchus pacificus]|uniref:Uncharacterized protein n=1 Tax=Pristionchus pacificus TaxID=54126 RepID=A0A2A6BD95_PRIPA|nr:hypothetical protein PRIPAC_96420 [Pristionchus pacificus]|eukprot:PDM63852.1 hypothetical protein PRIPAC_49825 [Pristionchus pacificus]
MHFLYMLAFIGLIAGAANGDVFSLPRIPPVPRRAPLQTHCTITRVRRDCGYTFSAKERQWVQSCPGKYDVREEFQDFVVGTGKRI